MYCNIFIGEIQPEPSLLTRERHINSRRERGSVSLICLLLYRVRNLSTNASNSSWILVLNSNIADGSREHIISYNDYP